MTAKELLYAREREFMSPHACLSEMTKGRQYPLAADPMRTEFQRDRDRIIHSKAFRRLMHKTQVFLCPEDDHYRTRLTHTLEVSQIARTIARSLRLNEDLAEAIALGHDLGHTPFGHAGERLLDRKSSFGFNHAEQSLRVVDHNEELNLTYEVRNGILCHSGDSQAATLEGQIVRLADRIAYLNHDIDDACRGDIIAEDDIPLMLRNTLGYSSSERIGCMVGSIVRRGCDDGQIAMETEIAAATHELRDLLFELVYKNTKAKGEEVRAEAMLGMLYDYYMANPMLMPKQYRKWLENEDTERIVVDFIAAMTDRYAINLFKANFVPEVWQGSGIPKPNGER
ncbi:MAG: deoxyguanosinetriphosphate triphosphohydrolase [Ruminococcaceae bacterium]|nr:deoxyguanosinetriphosphate triphosphohydrolase [Oscillospiraceae bacterium]